MLLTEEVEVKLNAKNVKHYENLGYEIPKTISKKNKNILVTDYSKTIIVKVKHLPRGSGVKVEVMCDFCEKEKRIITYCDYVKSIDKYGKYSCNKCAYKKSQITSLKKYGETCYSKTEESKERRRQYYLDKFGVEDYFQTDEFKEKKCLYNIEHYGVDNYAKTKECHEKMESTMEKLYGNRHALCVPEFKEKAQNTTIERFGVSNIMENPEIKRKIIETNMSKYGVSNPMQLAEFRAKVNDAFCRNGTQKTSSQQLYLHSLYNGEINYPISYYAADICFPKEKFVIEYNGGGHNLRVTLGRLTQEEFNKKEIIRNSVLKKEGYKQMKISSSKDLLPSDQILLQMLEQARQYFLNYPNHSWIEFNIDASTMRNAENKDGVYYDYGKLRRIKKSDVENINEYVESA